MSTIQDIANKHGQQTEEQMTTKEAKKWRTTVINDKRFDIKLIGGRKGISVSLKLKGLLLPIIGRGFDGLKQEDYIETPSTFTDMAILLTELLDRTDMEALIFDDLLFDVKIDGTPITDWDDYLTANYSDLIPLLTFVVKENFQSFFTGNGMMKNIQAKLQSLLGLNQEEVQENITPE